MKKSSKNRIYFIYKTSTNGLKDALSRLIGANSKDVRKFVAVLLKKTKKLKSFSSFKLVENHLITFKNV